jgi:uncharacterized protein (DUF302 family)
MVKAFETVVSLTPPEAEAAVREALAEQGFGVITEIDVAATLKAKLGVDRPPLKILGACNPTSHRALDVDPSVSLLLPCNVVVEQVDGRTRVAAVDPRELMDDPRFASLAEEAAASLRTAIEKVRAGAP